MCSASTEGHLAAATKTGDSPATAAGPTDAMRFSHARGAG
eukprot:CAMPEP_0205909998 /NCGR_PEP_ID=MMETSP1325-20131115/4200_1 /ASSEMBLY_ACC=CAM_ASM_000708 /TAXON_ID=236786 /ORGANISM="Florenciella sp., Strain RCC1007" /LENGTH=39 /DNA_ID= /DNA_START= /DNA_END= /DNA_ORIENTATION=